MSRIHGLVLAVVLGVVGGCDEPRSPVVPSPVSPGGRDDDPSFGNQSSPHVTGRYPRIAAFIDHSTWYEATDLDTIARYDVVSFKGTPEHAALIKRRNPRSEIYYRVIPQCVPGASWGQPHNWMDIVRTYAEANDWVLRHHDGTEAVARGWSGYWRWGDFTSHCPEGTFVEGARPALDSRGLTLAEWMATRFVPWFVANHLPHHDGLWFEVIAEEVNRYWWHYDVPYEGGLLDWNRNRIPDRSEEGAWEAFAADWSHNSRWWMDEIRRRMGDELVIIGGGDAFASPLDQLHGFKNEDFLFRNHYASPYWTWWQEFYTVDPTRARRGYGAQRARALASWTLSVNQMMWHDNAHWQMSDPDEMRRLVRFGLGTTLLGDGYFCFYDRVNRLPGGGVWNRWIPELYELDLGLTGDPFERMVFGADTLYTRIFRDEHGQPSGYVAVNPNAREIGGVPPEDAVIEAYDLDVR